MQFLIFIIAYPIIWLISILPFPLLYLFSDFVCFLVYNVFGYRKKVVRENIAMALPYLSEKERLAVERKFYHHMCDMFLEMVKTMSISQQEMEKRFRFTNLDLYRDLEKQGKSIALLCAHYASYEWAVSMNYHITFEGYGIYKKINNKYFDKLIKDIRSKFKATLLSTRETIPTIEHNAKINHLGVYGFASDQSPQATRATHWSEFMGIEVPVHTGAEMLAKRFDMNVIFLKNKKVKRGYYEATFELMAENPKEVPDYEISDDFLRRVEKQIHEAPEFYLWTHKRWKHRRR
ncbi:MAG: lysophospholipid acyltransferase family protein [Flavobacterium sp. JAD_PAG50586_2]|nr:MAG: lysophospholipid acyltransferase family protein [Flavobacterium sp. JAD_PAG50586_2]